MRRPTLVCFLVLLGLGASAASAQARDRLVLQDFLDTSKRPEPVP